MAAAGDQASARSDDSRSHCRVEAAAMKALACSRLTTPASFSTPALSALLTFFIFVIGHFSSSLRDLAQDLGSAKAKIVFDAFYYLLPNFSHFSYVNETANGIPAPASMIGGAILYAVIYNIILLTATIVIFNRRNFK